MSKRKVVVRNSVPISFKLNDRVSWVSRGKQYHGEIAGIKDQGLNRGIRIEVSRKQQVFIPNNKLHLVALIHRDKD